MRCSIEALLIKWGYDPIFAPNGNDEWEILQREESPRHALLDWMRPGVDGLTSRGDDPN